MSQEIKLEGQLLTRLMPQKSPMLFCDSAVIASLDATEGYAYYLVGARECIGLDDNNNLPMLSLLEVMAQAFAAIITLEHYCHGQELDLGLFLSVRSFIVHKKFAQGVIPKGTLLKTHVSFHGSFSDKIMQTDIEVFEEKTNESVASAKLAIYVPDKAELTELFPK